MAFIFFAAMMTIVMGNRLVQQHLENIKMNVDNLKWLNFEKNIASDECQDQYDMIGECYTKIHLCYGFYDWQWKYYATASANGTTGPTTPHYDSSTGAGTHAVYLLFQMLPTETNNCNCGFINDYVVGKCHLNLKECLRFNTSSDVSAKKPDYLAWANPINDNSTAHTGYFCCSYDQNVTADNAVKDLQKKDPSCFV